MVKIYGLTLAVALALSASILTGPAAAATNVKVPPNKQFSLFDKKGKKLQTLNPGQSIPTTLQCVQIPCPPNFDSRVVCWKCESDTKAGPTQ